MVPPNLVISRMTMHNIFSCQHDIVILVRAFLQKKFHVMQGIGISIIKPDRIKSVNLVRKILLKKNLLPIHKYYFSCYK